MDPAVRKGRMEGSAVQAMSPDELLFHDGFGDRLLVRDNAGKPLYESLMLRSDLSAVPSFEFSLAQRLKSSDADNFVIGAFDGSTLAGTVGFYRMHQMKQRHKGWIWGVFVAPEYRGQGLARSLLVHLLDIVKRLPELHCVLLKVATTQQPARQLYLGLGFRSFGIEPRSLKVKDTYVDEEHMILNIVP